MSVNGTEYVTHAAACNCWPGSAGPCPANTVTRSRRNEPERVPANRRERRRLAAIAKRAGRRAA